MTCLSLSGYHNKMSYIGKYALTVLNTNQSRTKKSRWEEQFLMDIPSLNLQYLIVTGLNCYADRFLLSLHAILTVLMKSEHRSVDLLKYAVLSKPHTIVP